MAWLKAAGLAESVTMRLDNYNRFPGGRTGPTMLAQGPSIGPSMLARGAAL